MDMRVKELIQSYMKKFSTVNSDYYRSWIEAQLQKIYDTRFHSSGGLDKFQEYLEKTYKLLKELPNKNDGKMIVHFLDPSDSENLKKGTFFFLFGITSPGTLSLKFVHAKENGQLLINNSTVEHEDLKEVFKLSYYSHLRDHSNFPHPQDLFLLCLAMDLNEMRITEIPVDQLQVYQENKRLSAELKKKKKLSVTVSVDVEEEEASEANPASDCGVNQSQTTSDVAQHGRQTRHSGLMPGLSVEESDGLGKLGVEDTELQGKRDIDAFHQDAEVRGMQETGEPLSKTDVQTLQKSVQRISLQPESSAQFVAIGGSCDLPKTSPGTIPEEVRFTPTAPNPAYPPTKQAVRLLSEQTGNQGCTADGPTNPSYPPTKQAVKEIYGEKMLDTGGGLSQNQTRGSTNNVQRTVTGRVFCDSPTTSPLTLSEEAKPTSTQPNPSYPPTKQAVKQLSEQKGDQGSTADGPTNPSYPPTKQAVKQLSVQREDPVSTADGPENPSYPSPKQAVKDIFGGKTTMDTAGEPTQNLMCSSTNNTQGTEAKCNNPSYPSTKQAVKEIQNSVCDSTGNAQDSESGGDSLH